METIANTECSNEIYYHVVKVGDLETGLAVRERFMGYQLVGVVMAHQG